MDCHSICQQDWLALQAWNSTLPILALSAAAARWRRVVLSKLQARLAAVARQAPLADRTFQDGTVVARAGAVLRVRRATGSSAPTARPHEVAARRRAGFLRLAAPLRDALRRERPADDGGGRRATSPICNSPKPTGCRSSTAVWCASISTPAPSCNRRPASPSPISTATSFYDLTGSYGVNVFGYDFYKELHRARPRARRASSARCSAPIIR